MINGVEHFFVAEHTAEQKAEHHRSDAAGHKDFPELHLLELPHQKAYQREHRPLPEVAEHHTEQNRIRNRHKRRNIDIGVSRRAVHINIVIVRLYKRSQELEALFHFDGHGSRVAVRVGVTDL